MKAAEMLVKCLEAEGVRVVFGLPGAAICPVYDALRGSSIHHVLVRHEQAAGHAASGYARLSGQVGVCLATSGPGATNLITAIAAAYMDSIPLVALTGQVPRALIGRDVFQEADITGACAPFSKHCLLVSDPNELPRVIKEAFHIARTGRPGPVLLDLPVDLLQSEVEGFHYPARAAIASYKPRVEGHPLQIRRAVEAVAEAARPVIVAGGGVLSAHAEKELKTLAEQWDLPVIHTLMGVGALAPDHPLSMGLLGRFGDRAANFALRQADLVLLAGARVGDRTVASPDQLGEGVRIVHIDVDPAEIGKNLPADIPIVGDAAAVLGALAAQSAPLRHPDWLAACRGQKPVSPSLPAASGIDPARLIERLCAAMAPDGVIVADVGQNQMWAATRFALPRGRFLTSGGMGAMGYALPAAVGALCACPDRQTVAVCGDGGFQMSLMELATLRGQGLPLKIVLFNNARLGMIREIQDRQYGGRRAAVDLTGDPDFLALAAAYGIAGRRIARDEEIDGALTALLRENEPFLLECTVDPDRPTLS